MRSHLGEVWNTLAPDRRPKRVQLLFGSEMEAFTEPTSGGANGLARLRAIRHSGLAEAEFVHWAPGRLAVIVDAADGCLADHFTYCQQDGLPGIPREELLEDMRGAAEILDELYQSNTISSIWP